MAQTKIRREVMTTIANVTYADGTSGVVYLYGSYTTKRAIGVIQRSMGKTIRDIELDYSVNEYEMSIEDFVHHATLRTR